MSFLQKAIPLVIGIPYLFYSHRRNRTKILSYGYNHNKGESNLTNKLFQCYYCRNTISPIFNFCPHCGRQIVKNICRNCQELFFNDNDYCHNCNTKNYFLPKEKFKLSNVLPMAGICADPGFSIKTCPLCGISQDPNNLFCVSCGLDIHLFPGRLSNYPPVLTLKDSTKKAFEELAHHWGI